METREMRYFVAVAEELHFRRAAERLGIAQPALSRAISQLERRLGAPLLVRSSRAVALTPAGSVLLHESRAALQAVEAAERRTRRAASGDAGVVLATKAGASIDLLARLLDACSEAPDGPVVEMELCGPAQQERMLRDGRADVAILHKPHDSTAGFDYEELMTEGQVLVIPVDHPLAGRAQVWTADVEAITDLPLPRWPDADGVFPDGPGPEVRDLTQLGQLVSLGLAALVAPASYRAQLQGDLVAIPVVDAPPVITVIAWPAHTSSEAVAALVRIAKRLDSNLVVLEGGEPDRVAAARG